MGRQPQPVGSRHTTRMHTISRENFVKNYQIHGITIAPWHLSLEVDVMQELFTVFFKFLSEKPYMHIQIKLH